MHRTKSHIGRVIRNFSKRQVSRGSSEVLVPHQSRVVDIVLHPDDFRTLRTRRVLVDEETLVTELCRLTYSVLEEKRALGVEIDSHNILYLFEAGDDAFGVRVALAVPSDRPSVDNLRGLLNDRSVKPHIYNVRLASPFEIVDDKVFGWTEDGSSLPSVSGPMAPPSQAGAATTEDEAGIGPALAANAVSIDTSAALMPSSAAKSGKSSKRIEQQLQRNHDSIATGEPEFDLSSTDQVLTPDVINKMKSGRSGTEQIPTPDGPVGRAPKRRGLEKPRHLSPDRSTLPNSPETQTREGLLLPEHSPEAITPGIQFGSQANTLSSQSGGHKRVSSSSLEEDLARNVRAKVMEGTDTSGAKIFEPQPLIPLTTTTAKKRGRTDNAVQQAPSVDMWPGVEPSRTVPSLDSTMEPRLSDLPRSRNSADTRRDQDSHTCSRPDLIVSSSESDLSVAHDDKSETEYVQTTPAPVFSNTASSAVTSDSSLSFQPLSLDTRRQTSTNYEISHMTGDDKYNQEDLASQDALSETEGDALQTAGLHSVVAKFDSGEPAVELVNNSCSRQDVSHLAMATMDVTEVINGTSDSQRTHSDVRTFYETSASFAPRARLSPNSVKELGPRIERPAPSVSNVKPQLFNAVTPTSQMPELSSSTREDEHVTTVKGSPPLPVQPRRLWGLYSPLFAVVIILVVSILVVSIKIGWNYACDILIEEDFVSQVPSTLPARPASSHGSTATDIAVSDPTFLQLIDRLVWVKQLVEAADHNTSFQSHYLVDLGASNISASPEEGDIRSSLNTEQQIGIVAELSSLPSATSVVYISGETLGVSFQTRIPWQGVTVHYQGNMHGAEVQPTFLAMIAGQAMQLETPTMSRHHVNITYATTPYLHGLLSQGHGALNFEFRMINDWEMEDNRLNLYEVNVEQD